MAVNVNAINRLWAKASGLPHLSSLNPENLFTCTGLEAVTTGESRERALASGANSDTFFTVHGTGKGSMCMQVIRT